MDVIIIGNGVAGPVAALQLLKIGARPVIYEIRDAPSTLGGAINLTPNALKILDSLDILSKCEHLGCPTESIEMISGITGKPLGLLPFGEKEKFGYSSLRLKRGELQEAMISVLEEKGVPIHYGRKLQTIEEDESKIWVTFEDGTKASADLVFGCDGIHSGVRTKYVEPERVPTYTKIASTYGFVKKEKITSPIYFKTAGMVSGRWGSLLTVFSDKEKSEIYVAGVLESKEDHGRDGWKLKNEDVDAIKKDCIRRFSVDALPAVAELFEQVESLYFYPIYTLSDGGKFFKGRAVLLGDAAHAMPPGGQSVGLALEDAILLGRLIEKHGKDVPQILQNYDIIRRPRITRHYKQSEQMWGGVRELSWFQARVRNLFMQIFLSFHGKAVEKNLEYDIFTEELEALEVKA